MPSNKDESDFLWGMYQEHTTQGRHHEVQRTTMTSVLVAIAAGVLAFISNKDVPLIKWPLALFLIITGCFGAVFSAKHTERARLHMSIAGSYRTTLEAMLGNGLASIRERAETKHRKEWRRMERRRLHNFFIGLHLLIAMLGLILLALIIFKGLGAANSTS